MRKLLLGTVSLENRHLTEMWLQSVERGTNLDYADVLVVDNGSMAEDIMSLQKDYSFAEFHRFPEHQGVSKSWNFILKYNQAEYVTVSNNDVFLSPTYAQQTIEFMDQRPDFGMVSPYCQDSRQEVALQVQSRFDHVRNIYTNINQLYEVLRYVYLPWSPKVTNAATEGFDAFCELIRKEYAGQVLPQILGSCFTMRRQCLDEVGYFDETFLDQEKKVGVNEDFIMSKKLRDYKNEKWKQMMDKSCPIFHYSSQTRKNETLIKKYTGLSGAEWEAKRYENTKLAVGDELRPK